MPERPPTTPSEMTRARHFIGLAVHDTTAATKNLTTAACALACEDQETAVKKLGEFADRAEMAARAARNAARLLF